MYQGEKAGTLLTPGRQNYVIDFTAVLTMAKVETLNYEMKIFINTSQEKYILRLSY